jgi:hypothetical protein
LGYGSLEAGNLLGRETAAAADCGAAAGCTGRRRRGAGFEHLLTVGNLERDEFVGEVYDLGLPTHTDTNEIAALLRAPSTGPKIVFTTYQSSSRLAAAARK